MRDPGSTDLDGARYYAEGDLGPTPGCEPRPDVRAGWITDNGWVVSVTPPRVIARAGYPLWIRPLADRDEWWMIPSYAVNQAIRGHLHGTEPGGPEDQLLATDLFT